MIYTGGGMTVMVKDITDPKNMKDVFRHRGGGLFYTDTSAEQDLNGFMPINRHSGGIIWLDLNGENPVLKHQIKKVIAGQTSAPTLMGKRYLFPARSQNGFYLINPEQPDLSHAQFIPTEKIRLSGTASVDDAVIAFSDRAKGTIRTVDFSDINNPVLLDNRTWNNISGSPGRVVFWNHRMLIPAGRQGILFEACRK